MWYLLGRLHRSSRKARITAGVALFVVVALIRSGGGDPASQAAPATPPVIAAPTATPSPTPTRTRTPKPEPVIERHTERASSTVAFTSRVERTDDLDRGVTRVSQTGRDGVRVKVYRVVTTDGVETSRQLVDTFWKHAPVTEVTLRGTHVDPPPPPAPLAQSQCDSNYTGACVPIASDVDCAGGSGNGPAYVSGPVEVVGTDIYGLDSDGDGYGCES